MKKERIAKLVHTIIAHYIQQNLSPALTQGVMTTITAVTITPKLDLAKVYFSFVGGAEELQQEKFLQTFIVPHAWPIRKAIADKLRHITRNVPKEIRFYVDPTPAKAAAIEKVLRHLSLEEE